MHSPGPPLRVWHVAETYPPEYGGGAGLYVRDVCHLLADRGHEVRVLCTEATDAPAYSARVEWDGPVRVTRLNLPYFKREDPGGWRLGLRAWRRHGARVARLATAMLDEWTPDLAQFHTPHPVDEEFVLAVRGRGVPVVGMSHCGWAICPRLNLLRSPAAAVCSGPGPVKCLGCLYSHYDGGRLRAAAKLPWRLFKLGLYPAYRLWRRTRLRRSIQGIACVSRYMAATHDGHVGGTTQFVPLGIDLTGRPGRVARPPRQPLRFGFMAGFQGHKGVWDLLDASAALSREGLPFELHLWGPGQEGREAELAARGLSGTVVLRGSFAPGEKWTTFSDIDVLVMATTVAEAYGRVVQEAAAVGVPTIAPAVGGITEQIRDGVDGLLYRFRDPADLARQMGRVIRDPGLVGRLAGQLRPVLDTRAAVAGLEHFYYAVLGIPASGRPAESAGRESPGTACARVPLPLTAGSMDPTGAPNVHPD